MTDPTVRNLLLVALIALAALNSACSRGVIDSDLIGQDAVTGSNNIYRSYELAHDQQRRRTALNAVFSVKDSLGTYVHLTPPSKLLVNNRAPQDNTVIDRNDGGEVAAFYAGFIFPVFWFYMGDQSTSSYTGFVRDPYAPVNVKWTDQFGSVIEDRLQMPRFSASAPASLHMGEDLVITAAGEAFDTISVQIKPEYAAEPVTVITQSFPSSSSLRISSGELNTLPRGSVTISVEASSEETLDPQSSAGGKATLIFKHKPLRLNLVY